MTDRITPSKNAEGLPCSMVAVGCAYEIVNRKDAHLPCPLGLKRGGYLPLNDMNRYVRNYLKVEKRVDFKRGERPTLKEYLEQNSECAVICVLGHYIFANKNTYYSFFDNSNDEIVCVWILKEDKDDNT